MIKTIFRTIFYQFFLIFIGLSIGFIINAEWIGYKSLLLEKSAKNIFFKTEFKDVKESLINYGRFKIWAYNNKPENFEVVEEALLNEEFYWCKLKYKDKNKIKTKIDKTRIRWKSWEYYYDDADPWTEEEMKVWQNGDSVQQAEKAFKLMHEFKQQNRQ
jgi:hypothetical protein